jgi:hypothetical protein
MIAYIEASVLVTYTMEIEIDDSKVVNGVIDQEYAQSLLDNEFDFNKCDPDPSLRDSQSIFIYDENYDELAELPTR